MKISQFALDVITKEFRHRFKTCWEYVADLSDEEYLQLRDNPAFIALLQAVNFETITDADILRLSIQAGTNNFPESENVTVFDQDSVLEATHSLDRDAVLEPFVDLSNPKSPEEAPVVDPDSDLDLKAESPDVIMGDEIKQASQEAKLVYHTYDDLMRAKRAKRAMNRVVEEPTEEQTESPIKMPEAPIENLELDTAGLSADLLADISNMRLNLAALSKIQHYAIERIQQHIPHFGLSELISEAPDQLYQYPNIGKKVVTALKGLLGEVLEELQKIASGDLDYKHYEATYIIPTAIEIETIDELQSLIREDVDTFVQQLTESDKTIFEQRSGYGGIADKTLQEVGDVLDITRERVRQIEASLYERLKRSLRVSPYQIKEIISQHLTYDLPQKMPALKFLTDKLFFAFLEKLSDLKALNKTANPDELGIKVDLLDDFFAFNGIDVNYHEVFTYLYTHEVIEDYYAKLESHTTKEVLVRNYIEKLIRKDRIQMLDEFRVQPCTLPKKCAAAALLCDYPNGLPWREIGEQVNALNISRTKLEVERVDNGALGDNKYTYLLDKGQYGNIKFLHLDRIDFDKVFEELLNIFVIRGEETLHLMTIHDLFHKALVSDYYLLRYIIRAFGEDYGFYFNGKSQVDNVSLNQEAKTINQADLVVAEMNDLERGLTKEEVSQLLKSQSIKHASFYLDKLMEEGRVVRIDHMLYSTPAVAYRDVDLDRILTALGELIDNTDKPIDYSYFEYLLNEELDLDYSMYFYASIARKYAQERGWFRKQFLFSNQEIPYSNVADIIAEVCDIEDDINQRLNALKKHVYIVDERGKSAIYQNMNKNNQSNTA